MLPRFEPRWGLFFFFFKAQGGSAKTKTKRMKGESKQLRREGSGGSPRYYKHKQTQARRRSECHTKGSKHLNFFAICCPVLRVGGSRVARLRLLGRVRTPPAAVGCRSNRGPHPSYPLREASSRCTHSHCLAGGCRQGTILGSTSIRQGSNPSGGQIHQRVKSIKGVTFILTRVASHTPLAPKHPVDKQVYALGPLGW
jgi:hypothetical protein